MSDSNPCGCEEYRELSRRRFLTGSAAAALAAAFPAWLPRVAYAQSGASDRDVLLSIYLRGGCDGLTMCVPYAEDQYYALRPNIAVPRPDSTEALKAIDLDGFFGFPPALAGLVEAYQAGHLLIVHATGSTDPSRSHFDAQRWMEQGVPQDINLSTGWLGRHLASMPPAKPDAPLRAMGISDGLQRTLYGGPLTLPIPNPANYALAGTTFTRPQRTAWLDAVYGGTGDPLRAAAQTSIDTIDLLGQIGFATYQPGGGAVYPTSTFATSLKSAAALIKADVGVEAIHVDLGGWDTHSAQGSVTGTMNNLMTNLGNSLSAFHKDIFSGTNTRVTVAVVSEFGRNADENGTTGTDHGHGNVVFLMGAKINGGRVLTNWPGLQVLDRGQDLQITIDYRDVLAEVVQNRLGNANLSYVFPNYTPTFRGVTVP